MNTERWQRVERLFQAALEHEPSRRAGFLEENSGGDESLLREVEEMLALGERYENFLERPALEIALGHDGMTTARLRLAFEAALARKTDESAGGFRLDPGTRLGPYEVIQRAGAGGMGEIYRARDTRLGRVVALKVLSGRLMEQAGIRRRFEAEAQAISSLNHPHICTLYDIGHHEDVDYLVMEFLEGQTLAELLKQGPVPYAELLRIATEVSGALAYAHDHGVIHRDVKPGNIMLTAFGAKLLDFGLARWEQEAEALSAMPLPADCSMTVTALILGTPQYMAPEQIERREIDARTDIFALGAVLFEMAAGRKAFEGQTAGEVIGAILAGDGPDTASLRPVMPAGLAQAIGLCLRTRPGERWQSAAELHRNLQRLARSGRVLFPPRLAKAARAGAAAAALLGLCLAEGDRGPAARRQFQIRDDTKFEILRSFPVKDSRGASPTGLIAGPRGVLYGTSKGEGDTWSGTVFELDPPREPGSRWVYRLLYAFTGGADGANPEGGLIMGPGGRLYGATAFGGTAGNGTVFELTPPESPGLAWSETVLHHFTRQEGDGCGPNGLVFGQNGELYGTTLSGGIPGQGSGTVFQLMPPATPGGPWTEKVLHRFTGAIDGANPEADLVLDNAGAVYGTTDCSTPNAGLVFKLDPPAVPGREWAETVLHRFTGQHGDGLCSTGGLFLGQGGALYGTTTLGEGGLGAVFRLQPPATPGGPWIETLLNVFTGQNGDGSDVVGGLAAGSDGAFYGTTGRGGRWGCGIVFELKPPAAPGGQWAKIVLRSLDSRATGMFARSMPHLVFERSGTIYGANRLDGPEGGGTVFQLKF